MKKIMTAVLGVMLLGGCKMKEFSSSPFYEGNEVKFTGAVEDRVNLWPVAYYREPVGSLAWPLISWGDDHLALRPFYSQYKQSGDDYDEFNFLWPVSHEAQGLPRVPALLGEELQRQAVFLPLPGRVVEQGVRGRVPDLLG